MRGTVFQRWAAVGGLALVVVVGPVRAVEFHVDPVAGDPANDGSAARPWRSLQEVIDAGLIATRSWASLPHGPDSVLAARHPDAPVKPGDTLWLRSGDYGELRIRDHYNAGFVTIAAAPGQIPRFRQIALQSCSHWVLNGLWVSPESGEGERPRALIHLQSHGFRGPIHDIVVQNCVLRSVEDSAGWSADDWNRLACHGIEADGARIAIRGNRLTNVNHGISVSATHALVEHNEVANFSGDGLRGLGSHSVFQYNLVKNCYAVNANHDDGFQSWSRGREGVGTAAVEGIVLRGNTILNYEDAAQPHRGTLQGIGCFDGMFVDWVIENNVVLVDHWHGITLLGARGCRIVNNIVVDLNGHRPGPPWIRVAAHKNGTPSADCIVRNNLVGALSVEEGEGMAVDHNRVAPRLEEETMTDHHDDMQAIERLAGAWRAGWDTGDVDALLALYAEDALLMPQNQPILAGKEAIRAAYQPVLEQYEIRGDGDVKEMVVSGDWGFFRVAYRLSATPKAGGETIHDTGKSLFIVRRVAGGEWKIARLMDSSDLGPPAGE